MQFSKEIIDWYSVNKRDLPWRNTKNPYKIWLSEVILQQTRVEQGLSYYLKFVNEFPTIEDLANADEEKVLKLWQGLGYYSRARNLHQASKRVVNFFNGEFPKSHLEIRELKGVGDYTAAAISSFAFGLPYAVVDGNVFRVLARVFGISTPIDSSLGKKEFAALAQKLIDKKTPALHNQAIMEFGAICCTPKKPNCSFCPLSRECIACNQSSVENYPIKAKSTKQRNRYFNYLVIENNNTIYLNKRVEKDIWANLYEFPLVETKKEEKIENLIKTTEFKTIVPDKNYKLITASESVKHILSHQKIYARFVRIETISEIKGFLKINVQNVFDFPVPRLIDTYIQQQFAN